MATPSVIPNCEADMKSAGIFTSHQNAGAGIYLSPILVHPELFFGNGVYVARRQQTYVCLLRIESGVWE
jgi:hypothetical protein